MNNTQFPVSTVNSLKNFDLSVGAQHAAPGSGNQVLIEVPSIRTHSGVHLQVWGIPLKTRCEYIPVRFADSSLNPTSLSSYPTPTAAPLHGCLLGSVYG